MNTKGGTRMKLADGVEMLELAANMMGQASKIHPVLLTGDGEVVMVDTGFPGQFTLLQEVLGEAGTNWGSITKIIMTHHDIDHIGNLGAIVKSSDHKIEVLAHEQEKAYIQGDLPPAKGPRAKSQDSNEHFKSMSPEQREAVIKVFANFKMFTVPVDQTLTDGQVLPFCGGMTVIHTPGHTPGHLCLYLHQSKVLIAGDALFIEDGSLVPARTSLCFDADLALSSLQKLTNYDIAAVVCYHGGLFTNNPKQRIAELAGV